MLATSQLHSISLRGSDPSSAVVSAGKDDGDLTSLSWLHKPGVLHSMCNALTGSPHRISTLGTRSARKPRGGEAEDGKEELRTRRGSCNTTEKMLNVVLSVRNRRYNGEDAHKPPLSFACMIFMALESSPTKTLPVKQIYEWIQWKFPHYRTASPGWKNSVRHSLSLNKCFKKLEKLSRKVGDMIVVVVQMLTPFLPLTHLHKDEVRGHQGRLVDGGSSVQGEPAGGTQAEPLPSVPQVLHSSILSQVRAQ